MNNRKCRISNAFAAICLVIIVIFPLHLKANTEPKLSDYDRILLAEALHISESLGNVVWSQWDKAPSAVVLVTPEYEFLIWHPNPSEDFALAGYDSLLKSNVYSRKRSFPINSLASFPAVNGVPTIVIGEPESTEAKTPSRWIITLLHEHFHQMQMSQPDYYPDVDSLGLARGDKTGMWMLDFPFPYDSLEVQKQFSTLCQSLSDALSSTTPDGLRSKLLSYLQAKQQFKSMLAADSYRYFSFQLWQEGIARYTEYRIAALVAEKYSPSKEFQKLKGYTPLGAKAKLIADKFISALPVLSLGDLHRLAFYTLGAAEGMLLDRVKPNWQQVYFKKKFFTEKYFGD